MYGAPMKGLDFFNIPDHPNFGMPASSLGASNFGVISSTGNLSAAEHPARAKITVLMET